MRTRKFPRRATWLVALLTAMIGTGMAMAPVASAGTNPPGNNGTVKIDNVPFDKHPDNEPHDGCTFQVDFYGYDEGDLNATVTFEAIEPTLRPGDDQVLRTDTVFIGEDDNSGGGSEAGLDAEATYTLDVSGITPQPNQGVHVFLTIHAEGSQGADVKHKAFWVENCEEQGGTTTTTTMGGGGGTTTTTTMGGGTTTTTTMGGGTATTLGGAGGAGGQQLPFTGTNSLPVAIAGLLLLVVGAGGVLASRRLRTR